MNAVIRKLFFLLIILWTNQKANSQNIDSSLVTQYPNKITASKFIISDIIITGNTTTKKYLILREMRMKVGDSIEPSEIHRKLSESKDLIYNSTLFSIVELSPLFGDSNKVIIRVNLVERWYIYPSPVFKLADRNFNEWYKTNNADFDRVTYGVKFSHNNLTGRGDNLDIFLLNGYSRNFSIGYSNPYINKDLSLGLSIKAGLSQNREVAYKTTYFNKSLTYKNNYLDKTSFFVGGSLKYRRGFYKKHTFSLIYNYNKINDTLLTAKFNPHYFNLDQSSLSFIDLIYRFQYIKTDNINYPLRGLIYEIGINKRGLDFTGGINMLSISAFYNKYYKFRHRFYGSIETSSNLKLPFKQPFINQSAMGYGSYCLSGLEYYVIDGVASNILKFKLKRKILDVKIPMPFKNRWVPYIPLSIFAKTFVNTGFAYIQDEYQTRLNNRLLGTYGIGIDLLSLYDVNMNLEYSFNQLGEKGLFLHFKGSL